MAMPGAKAMSPVSSCPPTVRVNGPAHAAEPLHALGAAGRCWRRRRARAAMEAHVAEPQVERGPGAAGSSRQRECAPAPTGSHT